jgi:hypothetical protein
MLCLDVRMFVMLVRLSSTVKAVYVQGSAVLISSVIWQFSLGGQIRPKENRAAADLVNHSRISVDSIDATGFAGACEISVLLRQLHHHSPAVRHLQRRHYGTASPGSLGYLSSSARSFGVPADASQLAGDRA